MTKEQLEAIFDRVRTWPAEKQREAAELLVALGNEHDVYVLSPEEEADIDAGLEEVRQGKFATDEEMKALFDRFRIK